MANTSSTYKGRVGLGRGKKHSDINTDSLNFVCLFVCLWILIDQTLWSASSLTHEKGNGKKPVSEPSGAPKNFSPKTLPMSCNLLLALESYPLPPHIAHFESYVVLLDHHLFRMCTCLPRHVFRFPTYSLNLPEFSLFFSWLSKHFFNVFPMMTSVSYGRLNLEAHI